MEIKVQRPADLEGQWEFVAADKFIEGEWRDNNAYAEGLVWEFKAQHCDAKSSTGVIEESLNKRVKERFNYSYLQKGASLAIQLSADNKDQDIYYVTLFESTMILGAVEESEFYKPYFRYRLRRLK